MQSSPITATGRLLCHVHRALDITGRRSPADHRPRETPRDLSIVDRELTRC